MRWRRKFEKAEFQALLNFDFCHTQGNRSKTLGLAQHTISNCFKVMNMVRKQENWVPHWRVQLQNQIFTIEETGWTNKKYPNFQTNTSLEPLKIFQCKSNQTKARSISFRMMYTHRTMKAIEMVKMALRKKATQKQIGRSEALQKRLFGLFLVTGWSYKTVHVIFLSQVKIARHKLVCSQPPYY